MRKIFYVILSLVLGFVFLGTVNAETPSLEQIKDAFNSNSTVVSYGTYGTVMEASVEGNKIIVSGHYGEEPEITIFSLDFVLDGNILTTSFDFEDETAMVNAVVVMLMTDSISTFHGYEEGEIIPTLNSDQIADYTIAEDGFEMGEELGNTYFKIDISKKITEADFSDVYLTEEDLQDSIDYIKGDGFSAGSKGYILYSIGGYDGDKEVIIAQKDEAGENAYKSIMSVLSVIFDKKIVDEFKTKYKNVNNSVDYLGIKVERHPSFSTEEEAEYEGYDAIRVTFNIADVKKEYKALVSNPDTSDNILLSVITFIFSGIILIGYKLVNKKESFN